METPKPTLSDLNKWYLVQEGRPKGSRWLEVYLNREGQISYDTAYMWNLKKMVYMNLFIKQKQLQM